MSGASPICLYLAQSLFDYLQNTAILFRCNPEKMIRLFFKATIWGLFLHPFMNPHDFSQMYNDLLLCLFFQTNSTIFNVLLHYQGDIQV